MNGPEITVDALDKIDFAQMPCIGDISAYHAVRTPDKPALLFEGHATSWEEIDRRANRVANALLAEGCKAGERIGYVGKALDSFFELMFGVAKAGMVLVPIQWRLAEPEIAKVLDDAQVRLAFLAQDQFERSASFCTLPSVRNCIAMEAGSGLADYATWRDSAEEIANGLPPPQRSGSILSATGLAPCADSQTHAAFAGNRPAPSGPALAEEKPVLKRGSLCRHSHSSGQPHLANWNAYLERYRPTTRPHQPRYPCTFDQYHRLQGMHSITHLVILSMGRNAGSQYAPAAFPCSENHLNE